MQIEPNERLEILETARHLLVPYDFSSPKVMDLTELPLLHSLILCGRDTFPGNLFNPSQFIRVQKNMKVLHFVYGFSSVAFKSLKHLRYLRLEDRLKTLPESTSSLHNLQTLNLRSCCFLEMLPKGMKHLKNLRYLDLRRFNSLTCMHAGLGQLTCLCKLSKFIVGKDNGCGIDELKELALEGKLSISGLHNVTSSMEAKNDNLIKKQNLRSLTLSW
ncbi:disease resistance protein RGA2-like [Hibiscus syriacus]|uniref:disease resistance protein RGA2-like n=1 Tax=Hibiscus syriacus TaxID=106335 RepID=UPI0019227F49|nr:disease resistance protein RGA2-like [Hibiscus syriacus]